MAEPVDPQRGARGALLALIGLTLAGGLLRFGTLRLQSLWLDEAVTVEVVRGSLGAAWDHVRASESTPPLYYLLAWAWSQLFGHDALGLRSFSALIGTLTIPLGFALGAQAAGRRVGLALAAIVAFNPMLFYYAQEARAYGLLVLLSGLSLLLLLRALEAPSRGRLAAWSLAAAATLATHYFGAFAVAAQGAWLVAALPRRRRYAGAALLGPTLTGVALLPLALAQRSHDFAGWIAGTPLKTRIAQIPKQFLVGLDGPAELVTGSVSLAFVLAAAMVVWRRGSAHEQTWARLGLAIGATALAAPLALVTLGIDYVNGRNVLAAWLPLALVAALGLGGRRSGRLGLGLLGALCAVGLVVITQVCTHALYQRDDWRGAVSAIGHDERRVVEVIPAPQAIPVRLYDPRLRQPAGSASIRTSEVVVLAQRNRSAGAQPAPSSIGPLLGALPRALRVVERRSAPSYELVRLRSAAPVAVSATPPAESSSPRAAVLLDR